MGAEISNLPCALTSQEIQSLVNKNNNIFSANETKCLWYHFMAISLKEPQISRK